MQSERAVTALLSLIMWNYDSKLLKQQLLDNFWWYFITGGSGWNTMFSFLLLPFGDTNNGYLFVSWHLIFVWWNSYRDPVQLFWNFLLTTHDQDRTSVLILRISLVSFISLSFPFYYQYNFDGSWPLVHIILVL